MKKLKLTNKLETLVDDQDYLLLKATHWRLMSARDKNYVISSNGTQLLHRFLLKPKRHEVVDHIDGNGLNNQRANLRCCSNQENVRYQKLAKHNRTGFKGVRRHVCGKFEANIKVNKKGKYLGLFTNAVEAAKAYNTAAILHFGEFAKINKL